MAQGCVFADGETVLRWRGDNPSTTLWPAIDRLVAVHGHGERTIVRWHDVAETERVAGTDFLPGELTRLLATGRRERSDLVRDHATDRST